MGWHLITGQDAGAWVIQKFNGTLQSGGEAVGLVRDGQQVAGVLYEQWNGRSIVAHIVVAGRLNAAFIAAIFDYPFNVCGAQKVMCPIPSDNARSIALATNMGFQEEARISDAAPTGDILIYTLNKSNCRFLKDRYGKAICAHPAARA